MCTGLHVKVCRRCVAVMSPLQRLQGVDHVISVDLQPAGFGQIEVRLVTGPGLDVPSDAGER